MSKIFNGVPWYDQNLEAVNASGGCLIKNGQHFYLFGEFRSENDATFRGITRYVSEDLEGWTYTGLALARQKSGFLGPHRIVERPKVVRVKDGTYVMLIHADDERTFSPCVCYATAKSLSDEFIFQGPLLYDGQQIRMWHIGSFTDDDGSNYLLTHEGDIYRLSDDGCVAEEKVISNIAPGTEAPAMFKNHGWYFLLVSGKTSWERNDNYYFSAPSITGPWKNQGTFCDSGTLTYDSQTSFVFSYVVGGENRFIYMGDRRSYPYLNCTTSVWLPIHVNDDKISIPDFWPVWDWRKLDQVTLRKRQLAWIGTMKDDSISIKFHGNRIGIFGKVDSQSGYALFTLRNSDNVIVQKAKIDFYSQVIDDGLKYISPNLGEGDYTLTINNLGIHGTWYDKSRRSYGSTDNKIAVTGYWLNGSDTIMNVDYNATGFPFSINKIGQNHFQKPLAKPNGVPFYYWIQSDLGIGQVTVSSKTIVLKAGQGILISPNVGFALHAETSLWQTSYVSFNGSKVNELLSLDKQKEFRYVSVLGAELYGFIKKRVIGFRKSSKSNASASELINDFISLLSPHTDNNVKKGQLKIAENTLKVIHNYYGQPLTNKTIAELTKYSVQYMLKIFSDVYQTTPKKELALYRVINAKQLLIEKNNMSQEQISEKCGFSSEAYMIRNFKNIEGITPGQFRILVLQVLPDSNV